MHPSSSPRTADALRAALAALVDGLPPRKAAAAVERLIGHYRGATPTDAPVLRDRADVVAYAAYRMPATFEAAAAALRGLAGRLPGWSPAAHLDLGGGTGAAAWAAAAVWVDAAGSAARRTTVLDWADPALTLGRELADVSGAPALEAAEWRHELLSGAARERAPGPAAGTPPRDGLVTVSYVLGELTDSDRRGLVTRAARSGEAVVLVEPGTPDGYLRIREARDQLLDEGLTLLAPCPHSGTCPVVVGEDWCHFAARVNRSSLHRRVKGGELPYEDEKFSYVAGVTPRLLAAAGAAPAVARVVRRPQPRKGQVLLDLCTTDEAGAEVLRRGTVSKRQGALYRAARRTAWGDPWPPPRPESGPESGPET